MRVPPIPRDTSQKGRYAREEKRNPRRAPANPQFQVRHRECVDCETVQVRGGKECQMRLCRQIGTGERNLIKAEEEELGQ